MAIRQYIGARYVPKLFEHEGSNDWVANIAYEPLTIVLRNGSSYTSKISVPATISTPPENDSEHWVLTGNYNAQMAQILITLGGYDERIDNVEELAAQLNEEVQSIDRTLRTLLVTPEMYGAAGDGTTDDTEAIQSAINAGNVITFSAKTYRITDNIIITGEKKLEGNGATIYTDILPDTSTNTHLIYAFDIVNGSNVVVDDFTFLDVFTGVRTQSCNGLELTNLRLSTRRFAIELNTCFNFKLSHIYIEQEQKVIDYEHNGYAWTDGIHIYGNSSDGVIEHIYGTTCDDMISLTTDEGTINYGSRGNIKNITIRDVKTVTKNILKDSEILYPNAAFNIIKIVSTPTYDYTVDNILIEDVEGKSFFSGGINISCQNATASTRSGSITINNCNIEKVHSNHNTTHTLSVVGGIENLLITNSTLAISDGSNSGVARFKGVKATNIKMIGCNLLALGDSTNSNNYAFYVDELKANNFIIVDCKVTNFLGYCNGYSPEHSVTFDIDNYIMDNCSIDLRANENTYTNHTLGIFACDTSFHGVHNIISNVRANSNAFLMHFGNSDSIDSIVVNNIILNSTYNRFALYIHNTEGSNYKLAVSNIMNSNSAPIAVYTNSKVRLTTHGALLNTTPTAFEAAASAGDIIEAATGVFYFNGTHFSALS